MLFCRLCKLAAGSWKLSVVEGESGLGGTK
jgi:hypothetical protein